MTRGRSAGISALLLMLAGCARPQSALDPKGPAADELARLFWFFTGLCTAVWLLVIFALSVALLRHSRASPDPARANPVDVDPIAEQRRTRIVSSCVAVTTIVLIGLTLLSYFSDRTLADIGANPTVRIRVTGHQWWWEVRYLSDQPSRVLITANEIHIPVGEPVELILASTDDVAAGKCAGILAAIGRRFGPLEKNRRPGSGSAQASLKAPIVSTER